MEDLTSQLEILNPDRFDYSKLRFIKEGKYYRLMGVISVKSGNLGTPLPSYTLLTLPFGYSLPFAVPVVAWDRSTNTATQLIATLHNYDHTSTAWRNTLVLQRGDLTLNSSITFYIDICINSQSLKWTE